MGALPRPLDLGPGDAHQLDAPPADLVAQVEESIAAMRSSGPGLRSPSLADDQDLTVGMRTRLFITGILGVAFTAVPVWRAIEPPSEELSGPLVLGAPIVYGAIFTSLFVWARDSMTRSAINRRTASTVYILLVGQAMFGGAAKAVGLTVSQTLPLLLTLYASIAFMYAVHVDRRMLWTGFGYLVAMAGALLWPDVHRRGQRQPHAQRWWLAAGARDKPRLRRGCSGPQRSPVSSADAPSPNLLNHFRPGWALVTGALKPNAQTGAGNTGTSGSSRLSGSDVGAHVDVLHELVIDPHGHDSGETKW